MEQINNSICTPSSRDKYKRLRIGFANSPDVIILTDERGIITEANKAAVKLLLLKSAKCLIGKNITGFISPSDKKRLYAIIFRKTKKLRIKGFRCTVSLISGHVIHLEAAFSSISDKSGDVLGYVVTVRDISRREEYETALKLAIKEKKVLLKEIHHRVKNSLQIIHSILSLQTPYIKSPEAIALLEECQHRIITMSFVHECLYKSKKFTRVNLNKYVNELMSYLFQVYINDNKDITLISEIDNIELDLQMVSSCGMIYNELISNSLKHAFRQRDRGIIKVIFRQENGFNILIVQDDGTGIGFNEKSAIPKSFGMKLVCLLTEQLNGNLSIKTEKGTKVSINFPK